MNRIRCLYAFFIAITLNCDFAFAQIEIGITGGAVYSGNSLNEELIIKKANSTITPSLEIETLNGKTFFIWGYYGGIHFTRRLSNAFSVKWGALYVQKGWVEDLNFTYFNYKMLADDVIPNIFYKETYKLKSIELPIVVNYSTPLNKSIINFGVGPYIGFQLKGNVDTKLQSFEISSKFPVDYISNLSSRFAITSNEKIVFKEKSSNCSCYVVNKFNYGAFFNIGLQLRSGLGFNISYQVGLKDVLTGRYLILSDRSFVLPNQERIILFGLSYDIAVIN